MNDNTTPKNQVFLIDGSSFLYRAYYGLRPLHTSSGKSVQAVYGFCRMLKKLIDQHNPENIILVWDSKGKTQRHEIYPEYKATRQAPPNDLFEQKAIIKDFAKIINLNQLEQTGFEADDLIYTAAKKLENLGFEIIIVSSDKDLYQVLDKNISILDPFKDEIVTHQIHEQKLGYPIEKIPFYFAILGDSSDNIPGVKGIGKKGAEDLVKEFESLEDLYKNLDRVKKDKIRQILQENRDNAFLSLDLFLLQNIPINLELEKIKFNKSDWANALKLFKELEFKSLITDIIKEQPEQTKKIYFFENKNINFVTINTKEKLAKLAEKLKKSKIFGLDTETDGLNPFENKCVGISICDEIGTAYYIPFGHIITNPETQESKPKSDASGQLSLFSEPTEILAPSEMQVNLNSIDTYLKPILEDKNIKKVLQNAKFDALVFNAMDINLQGVEFDTMIAANLVTPDWQRIGLDKLSKFYLGDEMIDFDEVTKDLKHKNFAYVPLDLATKYSGSDAHQTLALMTILEKELELKQLKELFYNIEMPLARILINMEKEGILLKTDALKDLKKEVNSELEEIELKIRAFIGEDYKINLNSPKQIEELLFEKLKLPTQKKSTKKTGFSTDQEVLAGLSKIHPIPGLILRYRELSKLLGTYIDGLPKYVSKDKKIHTSFSQISTATGRLSSSSPNLQNIPADKSKYSQELRSAFVPEEGDVFIAADYSQIELRVLAYISQDKNLIEAFLNKKDIHSITAAKIFDTEVSAVTQDQRQVGKRINFSILYGLTAYGLSQDLDISFNDAKKYIDKYFSEYPGVLQWMDETVNKTKELGYVETFWKRRRYIPGIYEHNKSLFDLAKRAAINTVAQGTAAEIMKIGMINLSNAFKEKSLDAKIILQIHDELLISTKKEIAEKVAAETKRVLESVTNWNVPLEVSVKIGQNWEQVSK